MEIFKIFESFWNESEGEMVETDKVVGFRAVSNDGKIIAEEESAEETLQKALSILYIDESNPAPRKIKLERDFLRKKIAQGVN